MKTSIPLSITAGVAALSFLALTGCSHSQPANVPPPDPAMRNLSPDDQLKKHIGDPGKAADAPAGQTAAPGGGQ